MTRDEFNKMSLDEIYEHIQKIENTCINLATHKFGEAPIELHMDETALMHVAACHFDNKYREAHCDQDKTQEYKNSQKPEFYIDEDGNWQRSDRPKKDYSKKENPRYDANTNKGRPNNSTGERYITTYRTSAENIRFRVAVVRDGKMHYVGVYKTLEDAVRARDVFLGVCEENQ